MDMGGGGGFTLDLPAVPGETDMSGKYVGNVPRKATKNFSTTPLSYCRYAKNENCSEKLLSCQPLRILGGGGRKIEKEERGAFYIEDSVV